MTIVELLWLLVGIGLGAAGGAWLHHSLRGIGAVLGFALGIGALFGGWNAFFFMEHGPPPPPCVCGCTFATHKLVFVRQTDIGSLFRCGECGRKLLVRLDTGSLACRPLSRGGRICAVAAAANVGLVPRFDRFTTEYTA